jgi:hypothetical protein|tara:strand:- start:1740 stop:2645 length:906 start_codon:yes stop_codon:yes gene_type:complete
MGIFDDVPSGYRRAAPRTDGGRGILDFFGKMDPETLAEMQERAKAYPRFRNREAPNLGAGLHARGDAYASLVPRTPADPPIPTPEVATPEVVTPGGATLGGGSPPNLAMGAEQYKAGLVPRTPVSPPIPFNDPKTEQEYLDRIESLSAKVRAGGVSSLTPQEKTEYDGLQAWEAKRAALSNKGEFSNETLQLLLPQIFSQQAAKTEADRRYNQEMIEYNDQQAKLEEAENKESQDGKSAFKLMASILPDFDFSNFGGSLNPEYLPLLIQYAMSKATEKANQGNKQALSSVVSPTIRYGSVG